MFVPITRIVTMLMSAVICFALLVPLALRHHNVVLAGVLVAVFVAYFVANVILWLRLKPRT
ncbi:MAG TPA: hypothetical protein VGF86_05930 [Candidatus Tumulicola sp.]|jgi:hypothetical protein